MTLLDEALKYAERNWYVFPCRIYPSKPFLTKRGKEKILKAKSPLIKGGLNSATIDKHQIVEWWTKYPNAAIGVNCGKSGLVVIDIDMHKKEVNGFENWMKMGYSDQGALHSKTPSEGLHLVFKGEANGYGDENFGVDVRGHGNYFIVPPSFIILDDKRVYYKALDDWNREPANVPDGLIEKLNLTRGVNTDKEIKRKVVNQSLDKQIVTAQIALNKLPQQFCEEHHSWITVGMALKNSLGESGFQLWDQWSQKSDKYDAEELEYQWDKMKPNSIGLGSLVYWSKHG